MSKDRADYWTDVQNVGSIPVLIEMTRFGLLWHGHAAIIKEGSRVERSALAVAWGADREQVYQDVLQGVCIALEQREYHHHPTTPPPALPGNGLFVNGCWRTFSPGSDSK
jgi:hypothetical protein